MTIDQVISERAFALCGSGHRLGDIRRLIAQYVRSVARVFPVGTCPKGGSYRPDVNLPILDPGEGNPSFQGCLDRNP